MKNRKKGTAVGSRTEAFVNELFRKQPATEGSRETGDDQYGKSEHAGLEKMIREIINAAVVDAIAEFEYEIYGLRSTVDENYNLQAEPIAWIMREVSDCKTLLIEMRDIQVSNGRPKAETRKRRVANAE